MLAGIPPVTKGLSVPSLLLVMVLVPYHYSKLEPIMLKNPKVLPNILTNIILILLGQ